MSSVSHAFQLSHTGWPVEWEPIPEVFVKFPFSFDFTSRDLHVYQTIHTHTSLGYRWLYISDQIIYIHRGGRCVFQLMINQKEQVHTAIYFFYNDVDEITDWMEKPKETLLLLLNKWRSEYHIKAPHRLIDIHAHVLFEIDDGAVDPDMSLEMLRQLHKQGVTDVCCSSHNWGDMASYRSNLKLLRSKVAEYGIPIHLHSGCELKCSEKRINQILEALNHRQYPTLADSPYVLLEFPPYTTARGIVQCARAVEELTSCAPVIAHAERYLCLLHDAEAYYEIQHRHIPVQINAYSLVEEQNPAIRNMARKLLKDGVVTFIGSDAHRTTHRSPKVDSGVEYIYENCAQAYADAICFKNAETILLKK